MLAPGDVRDANAPGGTYRESSPDTPGAWLLNITDPYIELVTAKGLSRGTAIIKIYDVESGTFVDEKTENLNASTVE